MKGKVPMPARLVALDHKQVILMDKPIILVGRHPECDVQLESTKISRFHCCLVAVAEELFVRDLESTNGTRVNGAKVTEAKLHPNDELTLGNVRFQVTTEEMAAGVGLPILGKPKPISPANLISCDIPIPLIDPDADERVKKSYSASDSSVSGRAG